MKAKLIGLPKAEKALVGMTVPDMDYYNQNSVATVIEQTVANEGYRLDSTGTIDLPDYETEIKSRSKQATSPQSIGSMSVNKIVNNSYKNSSIKKKFQRQLRVKHDQMYNVVTEAKIYDFSDPGIQQKIEDAYEHGRAVITDLIRQNTPIDDLPKYIAPNGHIGYFEKTQKNKKTMYVFRLSNGSMKKLESMAASSKTFHRCFS
jgi:hypothetical protein